MFGSPSGNMKSPSPKGLLNHATTIYAQRFAEEALLMRKRIPVTRRVLGESFECTPHMWNYAGALQGPRRHVDDLGGRDDVDEIERTARVLGGTHPDTRGIAAGLRKARAASAPASGRRGMQKLSHTSRLITRTRPSSPGTGAGGLHRPRKSNLTDSFGEHAGVAAPC